MTMATERTVNAVREQNARHAGQGLLGSGSRSLADVRLRARRVRAVRSVTCTKGEWGYSLRRAAMRSVMSPPLEIICTPTPRSRRAIEQGRTRRGWREAHRRQRDVIHVDGVEDLVDRARSWSLRRRAEILAVVSVAPLRCSSSRHFWLQCAVSSMASL